MKGRAALVTIDEAFCAAMHHAIAGGAEIATIDVSTAPSAKRPQVLRPRG
jgi:hypothetical protein